jgi:hypothetical protein
MLLSEVKTLQTLRRERDSDPGAAFTIEVAILRTNAELECVEAAEARAGQRLIEVPAAEMPAVESAAELDAADRDGHAHRRQSRARRRA